LIEGHTDSRPFSAHPEKYSNWELSTDRANAARRLMESTGLREGQVLQVRGFADQQLRDKEHPEAAANRRISVIVRYQDSPPPADSEPAAKEGVGAKPAAEGHK
jgi:chemotaxis protein MotB